ncbi:hypothetical protein V6Z11_A04G160600 [Gossypium hirsutum]
MVIFASYFSIFFVVSEVFYTKIKKERIFFLPALRPRGRETKCFSLLFTEFGPSFGDSGLKSTFYRRSASKRVEKAEICAPSTTTYSGATAEAHRSKSQGVEGVWEFSFLVFFRSVENKK